MKNLEEYMTVSEAAEYLDISSSTLRRWDQTGKLKAVRHPTNNYRYYRRADLEPLRLTYQQAQPGEPDRLFSTATADVEGNKNLRDPQVEAHREVRKHFEKKSTPAIVQIPVGCGKTGVMATLPFGIAEGRTLVIVPNTTIRDGVANALNVSHPDCFWRKTDVLEDFRKGPFRAVLDGPNANLQDCIDSHFVVANIQQLASKADRWLPQFPDDFFDLILVDEGHHNVADSWRKVFERFPNAKVVSLTATPFRGDGKELVGDVIYRYSYANAMLKGYIKQLHALNVAPEEISFTYRDDERRHTLEEVMRLREEAWFRHGVALSPECNKHIVEASIRRCLMLREKTGTRHQIIASTCSIDHARQVRSLYAERGLEAREVHSKMQSDEQDHVMSLLRDGKLDVVVQVQMLGEGFDHPPLSVAAVFRPYRSLSPYIQFVGRIMRTIHQNKPDHPDNQGYVVSHIGLNNDANWADFREIDLDDQAYFHRLITEPDTEDGDGESSGGKARRFDGGMKVADEILSHYISQSYLDPNDDRVLDSILSQKIPGTPFTVGDFSSREQLRAKMLEQQADLEQQPETFVVQPQERRKESRRRLDERTRAVAARVLSELQVPRKGKNILRVEPSVAGATNDVAVTRLLHRAVNEFMGINTRERNEPGAGVLEEAFENLDSLGDEVRDELLAKLGQN